MVKSISKFIAAAAIYIGFAVYLFQPYFKTFSKLQYLLVVNVCLGSVGCFLLSRRWVSAFAGSFFAGAVYGFGPFALGLATYHPTAGLLAAAIPWLFCPAAFGPRAKWRWLQMPLCTIPFVAIVLFFWVSAQFRLFALPIHTKLHLADLGSLFAPLVMAKLKTASSVNLVGFYHIPITALVIGLSMLAAARRYGIIVILCLGTVPAFCNSFLGISPIIWPAIGILCCSVLVGAGIQGLASASFADRKWIMTAVVIMMALCIAALLLATKYFQTFAGLGTGYAKLFVQTAQMYLLGAIATGVIYFMAQAKMQLGWLRLVILSAAMAVDVFYCAGFIIDKIF